MIEARERARRKLTGGRLRVKIKEICSCHCWTQKLLRLLPRLSVTALDRAEVKLITGKPWWIDVTVDGANAVYFVIEVW